MIDNDSVLQHYDYVSLCYKIPENKISGIMKYATAWQPSAVYMPIQDQNQSNVGSINVILAQCAPIMTCLLALRS